MFDIQTVLILVIIFLATFVNSTLGFGLGLIAMPLLAFIVDIKTAAPLVALVATTTAFLIFLKNWRDVNFKNIWKMIVMSSLGIPIGLFLLKGAGDGIMKIGLSMMIIVFAVYSLIGRGNRTLKSDRTSYFLGLLGGILGGAYNMGGPPIIIYGTMRQWPPLTFRATLQSLFLPATIFISIGHAVGGLMTQSVLINYLYCIPILVFTTITGGILNRSIPTDRFNRYVYLILILIGAFLLYKSLPF